MDDTLTIKLIILEDSVYIYVNPPIYFRIVSNFLNYLMETFAGTFIFTEIKTDVDIIYEFLKKFYIDYFVNNPHNILYSLIKLDYTSIDTYRDLLLIILYNLFE